MDVGNGGGAARLVFRLDENVLRLHVAVDHVMLVQILQNVQHLRRVEGRQRQPEALAVRERPPGGGRSDRRDLGRRPEASS